MSRLSVQCSLLASPDIHTKLVLLKSYNLSMRELIEQRSSGDGRSHESQKGRERPQVQLGVARIATCVPHMFAATSDQNAIRPDRNIGAAGSSLRESTQCQRLFISVLPFRLNAQSGWNQDEMILLPSHGPGGFLPGLPHSSSLSPF